jgi:L-alanine-DL-glutamate epimerase-like enolase superfamily enzyme
VSLSLSVAIERFPVAGHFTIARGARTEAVVVTATLDDGRRRGRGECTPYARYGETVESVADALADMAGAVAAGLDRAALQAALPAGAARNALDCAFWDIEAKRADRPVWALAGLAPPGPVVSAYTLSLDAPEAMRAKAEAQAWRPILKVKLGGAGDLDRLRAVRAGAPQARLIVDANEGWTAEGYAGMAPALAALGVVMVEQPLPAGADDALDGLARPIPLCADESAHDAASLARLAGRYDLVNLKLDKTGGLTAALAARAEAERLGFGVMVGCMLGSSLAVAPATLLAQGVALADLDAPLLLAADRTPALAFDGARALPPDPALWG